VQIRIELPEGVTIEAPVEPGTRPEALACDFRLSNGVAVAACWVGGAGTASERAGQQAWKDVACATWSLDAPAAPVASHCALECELRLRVCDEQGCRPEARWMVSVPVEYGGAAGGAHVVSRYPELFG
jgi:hypothetical protein